MKAEEIYMHDKYLEKISDEQEAKKYMEKQIEYDGNGNGFQEIYDDLKDCDLAKSLLKDFVGELPSLQRQVIQLRFWNNLNDDEIGYELSVTRKKVRSLLEKSFSELRERLVSEIYEEVPATA